MSQEQNNKNQNTEEVDLIVFFNYIGSVFSNLFSGIIELFKVVFSSLISTLRVLFVNWILILTVVVVSAGVGYVLQQTQPKEYKSSMLIEPKFDSKYQLVSNINYYNALIANKNKEELKKIFELDDVTLNSLNKFETKLGPETENDRILEYQDFLKQIDTSVLDNAIPFDKFIENRSLYSGGVYEIFVYASKPDVFSKFEKGLLKSFSNSYSEKIKRRRDTLLNIKIKGLKQQLRTVDSLQLVYLDVIKEQSKSTKLSYTTGDMPLIEQKQETKEYEVLEKELELRNQLRVLEEQRVEESVFYDVISSFQDVGSRVRPWTKNYVVIFPVLAFLVLCFFFMSKKIIQYTLNYEK